MNLKALYTLAYLGAAKKEASGLALARAAHTARKVFPNGVLPIYNQLRQYGVSSDTLDKIPKRALIKAFGSADNVREATRLGNLFSRFERRFPAAQRDRALAVNSPVWRRLGKDLLFRDIKYLNALKRQGTPQEDLSPLMYHLLFPNK